MPGAITLRVGCVTTVAAFRFKCSTRRPAHTLYATQPATLSGRKGDPLPLPSRLFPLQETEARAAPPRAPSPRGEPAAVASTEHTLLRAVATYAAAPCSCHANCSAQRAAVRLLIADSLLNLPCHSAHSRMLQSSGAGLQCVRPRLARPVCQRPFLPGNW